MLELYHKTDIGKRQILGVDIIIRVNDWPTHKFKSEGIFECDGLLTLAGGNGKSVGKSNSLVLIKFS